MATGQGAAGRVGRLLVHKAPAEWERGLSEVLALGEKDEQRVFGEALPLGLHLE